MKFHVRIYDVGATGLVTLTGTCSPYVTFNFDQYMEISTPIVKDTIAPIWPFEHSFTYETTRDHALSHKYMTMRVIDTQGGQETFLGSCYIDLETLACGPLQHDLPLWTSMGTTCGRIQLRCKMEQVSDVKVCMRDIKVVDLPMIEGTEPTTVLDVCYTNGPSIRSPPCLSTCSPSWDRIDLSFTGTLVSIWENSLRLSVCIQQSEGRAAIMGNAYLPFSKYHSNDAHEIIRFDEDVKIEPPFASSPTCHITGSLTMAQFPRYTPLIGGYHDEHGIHATRAYIDGIHVATSHETLNGDVVHDDEYKHLADERRRQKQSKATIDALFTTSIPTTTATVTAIPTSTTKTDSLPSQPTLAPAESSYYNPFEDTPSTSSTSAFEWMNPSSTQSTQPSPFDLPNPSPPTTSSSSSSPWDILDSTISAPGGATSTVTPVASQLDLLSFFAPPTSTTPSTQQQQSSQEVQSIQIQQPQQQPQQQQQSQRPQQPSQSTSTSTLPPHWEACIDPASGRTFYQNHLTKTTQWEYPNEGENEGKENIATPVQPTTVNITSAVTSPVISTVTPVTPTPVNPVTITPATVTPATVLPTTVTPLIVPVAATPTPTIPAATLPPHWEACVDPATGRTFYQNHLLKITQWEWPSTGDEPGAAAPVSVPVAAPVQPLVTIATPPVTTPSVAAPIAAIPVQTYGSPQQQPYIPTPTPIQSHHPAQLPVATPTPTSTPTLPLSQSIPKLPAGSAGYCIACTKPANYVCHQTREPVCSRECKLSYLNILGITPTDPPQQASLPPGAAGYCTVCKQPADYVCAQTKVPVCGKVCKEAHLKTVNKPAVTTPIASKPIPPSNDAEDRALAAAIAASLAMTPEQKTPVIPTPTTTSTLPLGWTSSIDPVTGKTFYIDTVLEKTQWEYPTPAQAHPHAKPQPQQITSRLAQPAQPKPVTQPKPTPVQPAQPTPASGSWTCTACTYVNESPFGVKCDVCSTQRVWTGTTTPAVQPQAVRPVAPIPVIPAVPLPPGWEACIDPNTGRTFYQNHITKTTQWQLPTAAATSAATPTYPQPVYANGYPGVR